jgi:flavin-binding protein dodecin
MEKGYRVIETIETSTKSWEEEERNAVESHAKTLHDLRVAEIKELYMKVEEGKVVFIPRRSPFPSNTTPDTAYKQLAACLFPTSTMHIKTRRYTGSLNQD